MFWSFEATYAIFKITRNNEKYEVTLRSHIFCWGLPTFISLVVYINGQYASGPGNRWCYPLPTADQSVEVQSFIIWFPFTVWYMAGEMHIICKNLS